MIPYLSAFLGITFFVLRTKERSVREPADDDNAVTSSSSCKMEGVMSTDGTERFRSTTPPHIRAIFLHASRLLGSRVWIPCSSVGPADRRTEIWASLLRIILTSDWAGTAYGMGTNTSVPACVTSFSSRRLNSRMSSTDCCGRESKPPAPYKGRI